MWFLLHFAAAAVLTIFQVAFLSHLPAPLPALSFGVVAVSLGIIADRPLPAAWWALASGLVLDLHGIFGFGTETALLFAALWIGLKISRRVLTNASPASTFLIVCAVVAVRWLGLVAFDGIRVLFGDIPLVIGDARNAFLPIQEMLMNGALVLGIVALASAARAGYRRNFLSHAS